MIHEKHFKLSCPQVNVNPDADADANSMAGENGPRA